MRIEEDRRFLEGVRLFNDGEFLDSSEEFEDLFFEAVRDEVDFVRAFLQLSVGVHHVERGQLRAAGERLEEALRVIGRVEDTRGWDLHEVAQKIARVLPKIEARRRGEKVTLEWPRIERAR